MGQLDQLLLRFGGGIGAAVLQVLDDLLQPGAHRGGLGIGQVGAWICIGKVGIIAAEIGGGEGTEGVLRNPGNALAQGIWHIHGGIMQDVIILMIEPDGGVVIVRIITVGFVAFQGGVAGDHAGIDMIGDVDAAEALRLHVLLQPVIHAEALFQHLLILFKAGFPGDLEGGDRLRSLHFGGLLAQHDGGAAIAAEGGGGRVHGTDAGTAGGAGEQVHGETAASVPGFPLIRVSDGLGAAAAAALQLLALNIEGHV